jgi:hypothetical protein
MALEPVYRRMNLASDGGTGPEPVELQELDHAECVPNSASELPFTQVRGLS